MDATKRLTEATAAYVAATAHADSAREDLANAIIQAARDGVRQVDIVKATGYTRERVRQICRQAGIS